MGNKNFKDDVISSISKRFDTTFIGAVSAIEQVFPNIKKEEKWIDLRNSILDLGNKEKRLGLQMLQERCEIFPKRTSLMFRRSGNSLKLVEIDGKSI